MLTTNPPGLDVVHVLPNDWRERALGYQASRRVEPLIDVLKALIRQHGDAAIGIAHVQDLALLACDMSPDLRFAAHERVFAALTEAAGGEWPIALALAEQPIERMPILDAAQRLLTCDGEWLALHGLVQDGWTPCEPDNRKGRDWTVTKDERTLPIEVKTKQSSGSEVGRLRFALRGLSMLPQGTLFRRCVSNWSGGADVARKAASQYFDFLSQNIVTLDDVLTNRLPSTRITLAKTDSAALSVQRFGQDKFALDFEYVAPDATAEARGKNALSLILERNHHPRYLQVGAVDAHFLRDPDDGMLDELELVLDRLGIAKQARKRTVDTVVIVIWEVPWHWSLDSAAVRNRWQTWTTTNGVTLGLLLPLQRFEPPKMCPTPEAEMLFPNIVNISA